MQVRLTANFDTRLPLAKLYFRLVNATPPLKRLVFANFGED
jgi:hypothetical protein